MSSVDEVIKERLRKLRCDEQIASSSDAPQNLLPKAIKKTNVEQVDDLLKQLSDETNLENAYGKDKAEIDAQIRRRLERLKVWDLGPPRANFKEIGKMRSVSDVVSAVLSRPDILEKEQGEDSENDLDFSKISDEDMSSDDSDAPPNYCVICKAEPSIVCISCLKESYCTKCFNEFHEPEDEHKTYMYTSKKIKRSEFK